MDWDFKTPCWDFAEFENPNISSSVVGSSNNSKNLGEDNRKKEGGGGLCSVDLKLGRLGDFGEGSSNTSSGSMLSTSPLGGGGGSVKRSRANVNIGVQFSSCLVEGCTADLSKCRDYHRRHKVCEVHSKTPRVIVGGQEQRFCQQCSRFHLLVEFDEVKRSCRKRLDGHNRRRRKPQPESLSMSSGAMYSNSQGTRLIPFANPQILPSTAIGGGATWTGVIKTEDESSFYNYGPSLHFGDRQNAFTRTFSCNYKGIEKQFPSFLPVHDSSLGSNRSLTQPSVCQPLLNSIALSENVRSSRKFSDELNRVLDSDCALSLLSSPPSTQTSRINMSHLVHPDTIPIAQPLPSMNYNFLQSHGMHSGANDSDMHCQGLFHLGSEGSSDDGAHHGLPFSWE